MTMRALPAKLKFAAYTYAALGLWLVCLAASSSQLALIAPLLLMLAGAPLIAYGLRGVTRWGYIALIVHAPTLVAIGAITLTYVTPDVFIFVALVHATAVFVFYLSADVRAPYLAREKRGFRRYRRFETNLRGVVETPQGKRWGETLDISAGGAYLHVDVSAFHVDQRVTVEIQLREKKVLRAPVRVVSINPEGAGSKPYGIGVQFTSLTASERAQLQEFIGLARRHERVPVELVVSFMFKTQKVAARTIDLSMSGCYVAVDGSILQPGDRLTLDVSLHEGDELELAAEVMWLAFQESQGKPPGAALQFVAMTNTDRQRLKDRLKEAGGAA